MVSCGVRLSEGGLFEIRKLRVAASLSHIHAATLISPENGTIMCSK